MKRFILLFLLSSTTVALSAQNIAECEQLTIKFHGIVDSEDVDQLFFEVSNVLYTGSLYYYPGFVLLNEEGDIIAKEAVTYYGIGTNFQTHLLDIKKEFPLPFSGRLELFGSYYEKLFCSFPIEIEEADFVSLEDIEKEEIKVVSNFAGDHIILDLSGNHVNREKLDYHFNITNENGEVSYNSKLTTNIISIPVESIGSPGYYFISVWDGINKKLLPTKQMLIY